MPAEPRIATLLRRLPQGLRDLWPSAKSRKERLSGLRRQWGRGAGFERDLGQARKYYEFAPGVGAPLDDRTWADLDMDAVFARLDHCVSAPGAQYLYRMLRHCESDEAALAERSRQCDALAADTELRESLQLALGRLEGENASLIAQLVFEKLPPKPEFFWLIYLSSAATLASTAAVFFYPPLLLPLIALGLLNVALNLVYGRKAYANFAGLSYLNELLRAAAALASVRNTANLPQLEYLRSKAAVAASLQKRIGWLVRDKSRLDFMSELLVDYLNLVCLFDLVVFIRSLRPLAEHRKDCAGVFEAVASLDATIAVASWRASVPRWCVPVIKPGRALAAEGLRHPLLETPVPNSVRLENESLLITGSNMAGKTTFLKTVGVNLVLGRTAHVCLAESCLIPAAAVMTSIGRGESLLGGKSHYFAEVERLREFIELASSGGNRLFLIDEIFRGTNTVERVSAAAAVLENLCSRNTVMVTTHDIELQEFLDGRYRTVHFSEQVSGDRFYFDYLMKDGPARSRNAIALLKLSGYPESVTSKALALAGGLSSRQSGR